MKRLIKNFFLVSVLFVNTLGTAQEIEPEYAVYLQKTEEIQKALTTFLEENKNYTLSNSEQLVFESMLKQQALDAHTHEGEEHDEEVDSGQLKTNYLNTLLTEQFFKLHPDLKDYHANSLKTFSYPNPCFNGDFETGSSTTYTGFHHLGTNSSQCNQIPANVMSDMTYFMVSPSFSGPKIEIVDSGWDPSQPALAKTHSGSDKAVRINPGLPSLGKDISVLRKGFSTPLSGPQNVNFYAALVFHATHLNVSDPFLMARIVDVSGTVVGGPICISTTTPGIPWNNFVHAGKNSKWMDWKCFSIPYTGNAGQNYFLEIALGDCAGGVQHNGYAYIDDICSYGCNPTDLNCQYTTVGQMLTWSPMPGAVGYEVEFNFNDPACPCFTGGFPSAFIATTATNSFSVPVSYNPCFSWRVRAVYADGSKSDFSERSCSCVETTCAKPINLTCQTINNHRRLDWNAIPGSFGYQVQITYNDPSCGCTGPIAINTITTFADSLIVIDVSTCFSWKVRNICAGGIYSEWSEIKCACVPGGFGSMNNGDLKSSELKSAFGHVAVSVVPNPANQFVSFKINNESDEKIHNAVLTIMNLDGKTVFESTISENETKRIDVGAYAPGLYMYSIVLNETILESGKLLIE